ncbi:hypothetical protein RSSM_05477 [Rhodopirellula sallentina SM41]|uniref:Uncharacterized protein n=1 Tax=Rhodopirellula sallentina SM41 TaxID=1263870 RepID=M5U5D0_9BACT|nr:hypothetical protein RSSM_05477 [Rhodopirellula sallentina SM41]
MEGVFWLDVTKFGLPLRETRASYFATVETCVDAFHLSKQAAWRSPTHSRSGD